MTDYRVERKDCARKLGARAKAQRQSGINVGAADRRTASVSGGSGPLDARAKADQVKTQSHSVGASRTTCISTRYYPGRPSLHCSMSGPFGDPQRVDRGAPGPALDINACAPLLRLDLKHLAFGGGERNFIAVDLDHIVARWQRRPPCRPRRSRNDFRAILRRHPRRSSTSGPPPG